MKFFLLKLFFLFAFSFSVANLFSQSYYQATVYFVSGVQRNITATDTSATITSTNVLNILSSYGISTNYVYPAFPKFNESDTLKTYEGGDTIKCMNKANIFTVTVSDIATRNSLINDLNNFDLNIMNLPKGQYVLRVTKGKYKQPKQVIIN
jgi:hypothetical protein